VETLTESVIVVEHPLVETALAALRDEQTPTDAFRRHARLLMLILAYRVLDDLPTREISVTTPLEETTGRVLGRSVVFVPVLRAGLAMLDAMTDFVPGSKVGFVGLERDEQTAIARNYYEKLPTQLADADVIILDPMLATGGSALATIELLQRQSAQRISLACVVAAPEGIAAVQEKVPGTRICTAVIDRCLNERKYILPGLGDFGDRYFGTT
jgi:uracil phosphoribosyltransferase